MKEESKTKKLKSETSGEDWASSRESAKLFDYTPNAKEWFPSVECGPLDISKALRLLAWNPTPMAEWISLACAWYALPSNRPPLRSKVLGDVSVSSASDSGESSEGD